MNFYKKNKGFFYILPAMIILVALLLIPLIHTLYYSFFELDYLVQGENVGLENYKYLLANPSIIQSFLITVLVTVCATAISIIGGGVIALWIDKKTGITAYLVEIIGLIPWVISMVVTGLLWRWLFNGDMGLFNSILKVFNIEPMYVIQEKIPALIALIFVMAWRTIGYSMVMILAGLKGLDTNLIEAARVDGANAFQILCKIKLPLIKTSVLLSTIVLTVSNFTNNTIPKVLTSGGPNDITNVITLQQYNISFRYYQFGESSALSILIMLVTTLMIIAYMKISKYKI